MIRRSGRARGGGPCPREQIFADGAPFSPHGRGPEPCPRCATLPPPTDRRSDVSHCAPTGYACEAGEVREPGSSEQLRFRSPLDSRATGFSVDTDPDACKCLLAFCHSPARVPPLPPELPRLSHSVRHCNDRSPDCNRARPALDMIRHVAVSSRIRHYAVSTHRGNRHALPSRMSPGRGSGSRPVRSGTRRTDPRPFAGRHMGNASHRRCNRCSDWPQVSRVVLLRA